MSKPKLYAQARAFDGSASIVVDGSRLKDGRWHVDFIAKSGTFDIVIRRTLNSLTELNTILEPFARRGGWFGQTMSAHGLMTAHDIAIRLIDEGYGKAFQYSDTFRCYLDRNPVETKHPDEE